MEATAVAVGKAALSPAFNVIFSKLSSQDLLKYARRKNVESEVKRWDQFLLKIECVLDDAEERQMSKNQIKTWLEDLRDLTYDVEDILDEFSTEVLRQKVEAETEASSSEVRKLINIILSCCSPCDIKFNVCLGSKMKEITQRFGGITKEIKKLELIERVIGGSSGVVRNSLVPIIQESQVYGREADKETIKELLSRDSNVKPVPVVAIVGMGGLGKTTLAQLVYDDETVSESFDIKAWVCVSDQFELDVFKITVKIIEGFTSRSCKDELKDATDLMAAQKKLKEAVQKKKFLLILDDVWNENPRKWVALSQPLAAGELGSKVLITTRNEKVALIAGTHEVFMHRLKKLGDEECLSVLALYAFGVNTFSGPSSSLREIGEQIAKKCDGLPLAATALGGLLRGTLDPEDWSEVLNTNIWELPQHNCDILPALRVSYHYLPSHLKPCFAYCAIFPKDYPIKKDDLIMWWMAQGFLEQSKNVDSNFMKVGDEYFNDLLSRSFFQPRTSDYFVDDGSTFVMHDLMNDLAMWISGGICLHLPHNEKSNNNIKFEKLRHSLFKPHDLEGAKRFEILPSSMKLRSFIVLDKVVCFSSAILDKVIVKMKYLRLLCLSGYGISELPHSISKLKQLRHLDMSFTCIRLLPESINDLLNLQVLKLNNCEILIQLPQDIRKLINLRLLDMSFTRIELLPESISDLLNLQVLKLNNCENLIQLPQDIRKLINLCLLDISETPKLKEMPSGICRLTNLQILTKFIVGENHGLRLQELKELSHIRGELSIWGLEKVDIQEARDANLKAKKDLVSLNFNWKEETSDVVHEKQIQILDELEPHSKLKSLEIFGYNGKCFSKWISQSSFTNLETLRLSNCRSVSLLTPLRGPWSVETARVEFPQLKKLVIRNCPRLAGLPNHLPSLGKLRIDRCSRLASLPNHLPLLGKLRIDRCSMLAGLPNELPLLGKLSINSCPNLTNLECRHPSLRELTIKNCSGSALTTLANLSSLVRLELENIKELNYMDNGLVSMLGELQELNIVECRELKALVRNDNGIQGMLGLKTLWIRDCDELEALVASSETELNYLPSLEIELNYLPSLETLDISRCNELVSFGPMRLPSSLKEMEICECMALKCLPEGFMVDGSNTCESALENLSILSCPSLTTFPRGRFPDQLVDLTIEQCENLKSMPKFSNSIQYLSIIECDHIQILPKFPVSVKKLEIRNLKNLALESTAIEKAMSISSDRENVQSNCHRRSILKLIMLKNWNQELRRCLLIVLLHLKI